MKHPIGTTMILLLLFLATQFLGLTIVNMAIPVTEDADGNVVVLPPDTAVGPPPEVTPWGGLLMLIIGIGFGTVLILLIMKFRKYNLWKIWFTMAAGMTMTISFGVLFGDMNYTYAALLGFTLAIWKVFRPNAYVHNFTELFIYPGIAVLFYHILSVPIMLVLLALISIYDVIAVFKSKHMVSMAKFQTDSKVFAGLAVPRGKPMTIHAPKNPAKTVKKVGGTAILGGGDVAFPLIFAAVVMESLIVGGMAKNIALMQTSIIAITTTAMLALLFFVSQKGKFYPAMPAVSAGAIIGWLIVLLL